MPSSFSPPYNSRRWRSPIFCCSRWFCSSNCRLICRADFERRDQDEVPRLHESDGGGELGHLQNSPQHRRGNRRRHELADVAATAHRSGRERRGRHLRTRPGHRLSRLDPSSTFALPTRNYCRCRIALERTAPETKWHCPASTRLPGKSIQFWRHRHKNGGRSGRQRQRVVVERACSMMLCSTRRPMRHLARCRDRFRSCAAHCGYCSAAGVVRTQQRSTSATLQA